VWISLCIYYIWYLSWPVVEGKVIEVRRGLNSISKIQSPRKYRVIYYGYPFEGKEYFSSRQGLFFQNAFSPNKNEGQLLKIRVCSQHIGLSCPSRPSFELFLLICISTVLSVCGSLFIFL
jgi:hypothetical protein